MGLIPLPPRYLNVVDGVLRDGRNPKLTYSGYRGVIRGIALVIDYYDNRPIPKLQTLMSNRDETEPVIISSTAFNQDGSVTTWTRMYLQRLYNPENVLRADEEIIVRTYPADGETRSSCCAIYRPYSSLPLKGMDFQKENAVACRQLANTAIDVLQRRYGTFEPPRRNNDTTPDDAPPFSGSPYDSTPQSEPVTAGTTEVVDDGVTNDLPF